MSYTSTANVFCGSAFLWFFCCWQSLESRVRQNNVHMRTVSDIRISYNSKSLVESKHGWNLNIRKLLNSEMLKKDAVLLTDFSNAFFWVLKMCKCVFSFKCKSGHLCCSKQVGHSVENEFSLKNVAIAENFEIKLSDSLKLVKESCGELKIGINTNIFTQSCGG